MPRTEEMEFAVVGETNNHLWFRVLHGQDKGMRVSVPVRHPAYDSQRLSTLHELTDGDIVAAVLISDDHGYANWRVESVRIVSPTSEVIAPSSTN